MHGGTLKVRALVPGLNQRGRDIAVGEDFYVSAAVAETLLVRRHVEVVPERPARPTRRVAPRPIDRAPTLSEPVEPPRREPTLSDPSAD